MAALMLDPTTGLDPPGVKVRAAEGIDAASSFIQGFWLWCATLLIFSQRTCINRTLT